MVPQLDGTYNVSDDSDTDLHSYLDLASSNIIAHRTRGQKQRYEINTRANTSRCLALKEGTKLNTNIRTQRQNPPKAQEADETYTYENPNNYYHNAPSQSRGHRTYNGQRGNRQF